MIHVKVIEATSSEELEQKINAWLKFAVKEHTCEKNTPCCSFRTVDITQSATISPNKVLHLVSVIQYEA